MISKYTLHYALPPTYPVTRAPPNSQSFSLLPDNSCVYLSFLGQVLFYCLSLSAKHPSAEGIQ